MTKANNVHQLKTKQSPTNAHPHKSFNVFMLDRMPLITSTGDGCDGLFAQITEGKAKRLYDIDSPRVLHEVSQLHEEFHNYSTDTFLSEAKGKEAITYLKAKAHTCAERRPVYKRLGYAHSEAAFYIDLSNDEGQVVRVSPGKWEVVVPKKPMFVAFPTQRALPFPQEAEDGEASFTKILPPGFTEAQKKLLLGTVISFLIPPNFPGSLCYPVMVLRGEPGSGKSTLSNLIKTICDNEVANVLSRPSKIDDLYVLAQSSQVLCFDNLDGIKGDISDAFCQITTGSAVTKRTLYSDKGRTTLSVHCPLLLNGIGEILFRQDIVDRSVTILLKRIEDYDPEAGSPSNDTLSRAFGYILGLMGKALANYGNVKVKKLPRLATLAKFVAAAEPFGCKIPFVDLLAENQTNTLTSLEEDHAVIEAILALLAQHGNWKGTYGDLLSVLKQKASHEDSHSDEWPKTARRLSSFLSYRKLSLAALGVDIAKGPKHNNGRIVILSKNNKFSYEHQAIYSFNDNKDLEEDM